MSAGRRRRAPAGMRCRCACLYLLAHGLVRKPVSTFRDHASLLAHDPEKWTPVFGPDHAQARKHDPEKWTPVFGPGHAQEDIGMRIDISFLPVLAAAFLLTFARIGTMVMLLPGVGEMSVPSRVRLTMALVLTAILLPAHQAAYNVDLTAIGPVLVVLFQELIVGAVLGMTARLAISALQIAGSVIAQQLGLGFVTAVDPTQNQQGLIVGNFLTVLGITLIFATDMHHLVIAG